MIKSIFLAALGVLVALALVGVSSAAAAIHIETCMEKEKTCKTASVGTTYTTISKEFVMEEEEEVTNKCELKTTHEVTDPTSEKAEDPLKEITTAATFSGCTEEALEPTGLPWTLTTNQGEWEKTHEVELFGYGFKGTFCSWVLNAPGDLVRENLGTRVVLGNMLGQGKGLCPFWLRHITNTLTVNSVNDPNLTGAVDVIVK